MDLVFAPSQIGTWPHDRLRPYARNAKIHGTDQVAKIAASTAKIGWTVPCLVADDGELIAGHGRALAAAMLGLKDVPVRRRRAWDANMANLGKLSGSGADGAACRGLPCSTTKAGPPSQARAATIPGGPHGFTGPAARHGVIGQDQRAREAFCGRLNPTYFRL